MFSLHVNTSRTWGRGESQVLLTVFGLRALGHRAVLVAHPEGEILKRAAEGHDLIPLAPRAEVDLAAAWRLSRVIKQLRPGIVHAHDPHGVAMAALALSFGTIEPDPPLVATRRVDSHIRGHSFSRWKYRQVDCFLAVSDAVRAVLVADGVPSDQIVTVYEGVDVEMVAATSAANVQGEFWLPTHAPIVGSVGSLVPRKGHRHFIEAASRVLRQVPDARFVILGEGPLRSTLERLVADLHLEKHVVLAGFRSDGLAIEKGLDVFVVSAVTGGFGTSLLEAMACGRPVVATRTGGTPEVVVPEDTGLLVEPTDAHALADAIVRLLGDRDLRERMGRAAVERVRTWFSAERMVAETLRVYQQMAGRHHAADTAGRAARG